VTVEKRGGGAWGPLHWSKVRWILCPEWDTLVTRLKTDLEVFEDGLNFRPLHGEEVEQSLGHEGDQALDDGDGGVVFEVRIGVGRFGDRGRGVDDFDGENGSFISH
jgi:hypothetical protein